MKDQVLTEGWRFALNPTGDPSRMDYDDTGWREVRLPHDWQIEGHRDPKMPEGGSQGYYPRGGVGWYRTTIPYTPGITRLCFDGVQRFYTVWLNGEKVGEKAYGYVPYVCEITLKPGENILAVKVDNTTPEGVTESQLDRWYSGAGIYREVTLLSDGLLHIAPYGVRTDYTLDGMTAALTVTLTVDNRTDADTVGVRLDIAHTTKLASVRLAKGVNTVALTVTLPDIVRWEPDAPTLYPLHVELNDGQKTLDAVTLNIGFRESVFDPDCGYLLNGRQVKLRGVNLHHDHGAFGAAVERSVLRRRLERLKEIGCNAIRCSHNPKESFFYDLCDEIGFLVIDELYDEWVHRYYKRFFAHDRYEDLAAMVARDRNHPCVILWSVGNESPHQYSDEWFTQLQELCDACRELDPARPVSYALIGHVGRDFTDPAVYRERIDLTLKYAEIVDVFMGNYMEGFYEALRREGMRKAVIGSETFAYYRLQELTTHAPIPVNAWNDVEVHDYVAGGFLWAGIDYLGESMGWPAHGWTGCPIDAAGFVKLRGYHTKAMWTDAPMVKLAVFDETEPYDLANANWSFPQMTAHWNQGTPHKMMHVGVFTNCEKVRLTLNGGLPRYAAPAPDRMAHFYVSYAPGTLVAEGLRGGVTVCTQTLKTSYQGDHLILGIYEKDVRAGEVVHAELTLYDRYGQVWTQDRPKVRVEVTGGELLYLDNGDFLTTDEVCAADTRTLWNGHLCAYIRTGDTGTLTVTAYPDGYAKVSREIRSARP